MAAINFTQARYASSAHYPSQWPPDVGVEVAFAGRSNVGKSSAINAITQQNRLAITSKTPGRTRQINFFNLDAAHRLVDLPGYGFASAPQSMRRHWQQFATTYLTERNCLRALVLPMDIRRPLGSLDAAMLECCWQNGLAVHVLLTKADKFKRGKASNVLHAVREQLQGRPQTTVQLFSALKKQGVDEARQQLAVLFAQN